MCNFKSGIIFKNRVVLAPNGNESHSDLLESLNIKDDYINTSKVFVRAELIPENYNKALPIEKWKYKVDQDIVPVWYEEDPERYEKEFRDVVSNYLKTQSFESIYGYAWDKVEDSDAGLTYYFMDGFYKKSNFGNDNNYANSIIRKDLNNSKLAKELKEKFGDKLVPITTNLLTLDGLDDYGTVEGDVIAIPTLDLYRRFRKSISKINDFWYLATPHSIYSYNNVMIVMCTGNVTYDWYTEVNGVRPFFILKS